MYNICEFSLYNSYFEFSIRNIYSRMFNKNWRVNQQFNNYTRNYIFATGLMHDN